MTNDRIHRAAKAVAQLLYGDIEEDHPSWEACVEIAEVALRAATSNIKAVPSQENDQ